MADYKSLKDLFKSLEKKIEKAVQEKVPQVVEDEMISKIKTEVYAKYEPQEYVRKGVSGGLIDPENIESVNVPGGVRIRNIRDDISDETNEYRDVARIVEYGGPYEYSVDIDPRPFTEATRESLRESGKHIDAVRKGLKEQGLKVE